MQLTTPYLRPNSVSILCAVGERGEEGVLPEWTGSFRSVRLSQLNKNSTSILTQTSHLPRYLLNNLPEENGVHPMIVYGVKVPPELGAWQRAMPELVYEFLHPLLLPLEPQVVAIACLRRRAHTHTHTLCWDYRHRRKDSPQTALACKMDVHCYPGLGAVLLVPWPISASREAPVMGDTLTQTHSPPLCYDGHTLS